MQLTHINMKFILCIFVIIAIANTLACPCSEATTIQIQNYDGPIYLHIPGQSDDDCSPSYPQAEIECTCIAKPSIKYIPINTASESQCYKPGRNCGTSCGSNCGGTCACGAYNVGDCNCGAYSGLYANGRGCKGDKVYTLDIVKPQSVCEAGYNNHCICHKHY